MEGIDFLSFAQEVSTLDRINYQYFNQLLNNRTIILNEEIGKVFCKVLEHAGVYKRTKEGKKAFVKFAESVL